MTQPATLGEGGCRLGEGAAGEARRERQQARRQSKHPGHVQDSPAAAAQTLGPRLAGPSAKRGRTVTQLPKETRRLRPAQGARSHCPPVPGRQTLPRQQRGQRERPPGLLTPRPQALPPAWCPCPAPSLPGLVPASQRWGAGPCSGHCGGPGPTPGVFPEQPRATQASTPQPMRAALSPCPPSHSTEQRPALGSTSPEPGTVRAVTQPWTPVTRESVLCSQTALPGAQRLEAMAEHLRGSATPNSPPGPQPCARAWNSHGSGGLLPPAASASNSQSSTGPPEAGVTQARSPGELAEEGLC